MYEYVLSKLKDVHDYLQNICKLVNCERVCICRIKNLYVLICRLKLNDMCIPALFPDVCPYTLAGCVL